MRTASQPRCTGSNQIEMAWTIIPIVRELQNYLERAVILTQGSILNVATAELKTTIPAPHTGSGCTFHDAEQQAIIKALKAADGKIAGAGGAAERRVN
jgi:formate hydrogenlyase transcriptional activator